MQFTEGSANSGKFCSSFFEVSEALVVCKEEGKVDVFIIGCGVMGLYFHFISITEGILKYCLSPKKH